jgi:hypothetical protein
MLCRWTCLLGQAPIRGVAKESEGHALWADSLAWPTSTSGAGGPVTVATIVHDKATPGKRGDYHACRCNDKRWYADP